MPEFERGHGETDAARMDTTRATARLPGLDIEITHRHALDGGVQQISINLTAAPWFGAFGHAPEATNPFAFWMQAAQFAWQPWLVAARALALPWTFALPRPKGDDDSRSARERGSPG